MTSRRITARPMTSRQTGLRDEPQKQVQYKVQARGQDKGPERGAGQFAPSQQPVQAFVDYQAHPQDGDFAHRLKMWRKLNGIKQTALADMLGVSQSAVSFWETGRDAPSAASMARLNALIARSSRDELRLERLFVHRQAGIRALYDFDGLRLMAASQGFHEIWPEFAALEGQIFAGNLVNEARLLTMDGDLRRSIVKGELGIASGVSTRMTDLELDTAVLHRWHMCFRRHGHRMLVDVVYEPCATTHPAGILDLVYLDDALGSPAPR